MKTVKSFIKSNKALRETAERFIFFKDAFPRDIFNFEKLPLFLKVYPYTMISYKRLSNIYDLAKKVAEEKKEGCLAECGVWRGGCSAVMAFVAEKEGKNRKTWLFDSFEGLPEPTKEDGQLAKSYSDERDSGELKTINKCVGPLEDVKKIFFEILNLNEKNIIIEKGWFQDVLPEAKKRIGPISVLRLDGDWYESTKVCLDELYDNVVKGGYIIIDDYGHWVGSKKALDEFSQERKLSPKLIKIDYTGVYFKKP